MKNITDYIDTAISRSGCKSNRKFCELLGVSPVWIINTRKGTLPTDETMLRLAEIAGVPPHKALLDLNIWRSTGKAKMIYVKLSESLKGAPLAAFFAVVLCQVIMQDSIYYGK